MVFRTFYIQVILRILLLVLSALLLAWLILKGQPAIFYINMMVILALQIVFLIRYINTWNTELHSFFKGIKESGYDIPLIFKQKRIEPVSGPLNELKEHILEERKQHQIENEYFKVLSAQVATGILVINDLDEVLFCNAVFLHLFDLETLRNLDGMERKHPGLYITLSSMIPGKEIEIHIKNHGTTHKIQGKLSIFSTASNISRVFTFDDVSSVISRNEVESWQKLIRVLNHEIMNSVGPINSTTEMLLDRWNAVEDKNLDEKLLNKTKRGLEIIGERSRGLSAFARAYRSLTKAPEPKFSEYNLLSIVNHCIDLFASHHDIANIKFNVQIPEETKIFADQDFLQQIIINLIKNAIESFCEMKNLSPEISISFTPNLENTVLAITDNGAGMDKAILEKATVPFFTTKQTGSGIGLSLSRQLIQAMNGSMEIQSEMEVGTTVRLIF